MVFITHNFVPLLFLLTGFPVAFSLAATGLPFGLIGMEAGMFSQTLFQALPLRIFGIMQNEILLAVPFFIFMGIILERSAKAEDPMKMSTPQPTEDKVTPEAVGATQEEDPMEAVKRALDQDAKKK